ncbi:unnamed protein product [Leptosia nina]|uniref:Uncharacterized protein n=1 Tax=Leptosia nina TaxID=320188 RepID=A0AAV1JXE4_9NEOP
MLMSCLAFVVSEDAVASKDLEDDYDDIGRKHRKKKKHQGNPCYGRTFGEKFGPQDNTYISAPVTNYFFGCGGLPAPVAPVYPQYGYGDQGHGGHGHGGHGHGGHGHGGHGHGSHGGNIQGAYPGGYPQNGYNGFQQFNPGFGGVNRPLQNVVSSAAAGFGNAVASAFSRPRKTYRQINRFFNNLF